MHDLGLFLANPAVLLAAIVLFVMLVSSDPS
jgi:hypothetical protein